jgi:DNA-binding response OmpR family regulator
MKNNEFGNVIDANSKFMILIVEDDKSLSTINRRALESVGYMVESAYTLAEARERLARITPDLILLDVKLPDGSGFGFCREIRESCASHIIFLTSVTESSGELEGLRAGGNDYLRKPYGIELLRERVNNAIRQGGKAPRLIKRGPLTLDIISSRALLHGEDKLLSQKEFALLYMFIQHENSYMAADHLYEQAWGQPMANDDNAVKVTISKLRSKLKGSGCTITGKRGEGYCFERNA